MKRTANLNLKIVKEIENITQLRYIPDELLKTDQDVDCFTPIDVLDYVYAYLHSPSYRKKYSEFLKTDFPRVPQPKNKEEFLNYCQYGSKLRRLHLMDLQADEIQWIESSIKYISNHTDENLKNTVKIINKKSYVDNKMYINEYDYFEGVPQIAYDFYIGGYQPAQKWLKDRKGQALSKDDIEHYKKIVFCLEETDRVMKKIDLLF